MYYGYHKLSGEIVKTNSRKDLEEWAEEIKKDFGGKTQQISKETYEGFCNDYMVPC